ncbi:DUF2071 domain-containing protein [Leptobacterium flavescens]|uniref:DUF2071 domain-containing protein n=1 Tax=Leptobacterium flavescens TaxID=472055 RepID=A0A6P0UHW9_9FLAO|nr:DUF2071 domain-containing protein [Leptobacterium flavescens]NER12875.1 DUF2071 domain-containing protein [Leptobacterium flavescens]
MSFLKAEWRKLAIANYEIDASLLSDYIPFGTELDLWNGRCYLSLVGFMFVNTKLLGLKFPGHVNFEEVNLRFYVKRPLGGEDRRGVVFIKEIVPKPALTFIANSVYKEHYQTLEMDHVWEEKEELRTVEYQWKTAGIWNSFKVEASREPTEILQGSEAEFITEHYWGYTRINNKKSYEYEVTHPRWQQYEVKDCKISVDFEKTYGSQFGFLNKLQPVSVMLAEGSEITVENKSSIV